MLNTLKMTNMSTATNHGQEVKTGPRTPIGGNGSETPFISRPKMKLPLLFLTKSHCGGFCYTCHPSANATAFEESCRTVSWNDDEGDGGHFHSAQYGARIVKKAIHLFRNPFDNIVSRMHHAISHQNRVQYSNKLLEKLLDPSGKKALRTWCEYIDEKFERYVPSSIRERSDAARLLAIPCHADFIRYVLWHNYALEMTKQLEIPVHTLYYENYTSNYNETVSKLYNFLGHRIVDSPHPFDSTGKTYLDKFEPRHVREIAYLMRALASNDCWVRLRHYFNGMLVETLRSEAKLSDGPPQIAWLLSFPESVSYTALTVASFQKASILRVFPFLYL